MQLFHTQSLYSNNGRINEIYSFSKDVRFNKNFRDRRMPIRCHAREMIEDTCGCHLPLSENMTPRCFVTIYLFDYRLVHE